MTDCLTLAIRWNSLEHAQVTIVENLHTNLALIDVPDSAVEVHAFAPYDREQHHELEAAYGDTHFFRRRQDTLEVVRLDPTAENIGDSSRELTAHRLGGLLPALVEEAIGRFLLNSGSKLKFRRRHPMEFVSLESKNDLAHQLFSREIGRRLPLGVLRGYRIEGRTVTTSRGRRTGLLLSAQAFSVVDANCTDLLADGFDITGLYVQESTSQRSALIQDPRRTIGIVHRVVDQHVILGEDRRVEETEFEACQVYLDPSPAAVRRLLDHYVGADAHDRLWGDRGELASVP